MNCWLDRAMPLPSALVSATTLLDSVLLLPPYRAMPLARLGCTTVLLATVLPESAAYSDQNAIASSPVLRKRLFWMVMPVLFWPISQMPTSWCCTHTSDTSEPAPRLELMKLLADEPLRV